MTSTNDPTVPELALRLKLTSEHAADVIEATGAPKRRVMHCINELANAHCDGFDARGNLAATARWLADTTRQFTNGVIRQDSEIYTALARAIEKDH